MGELLDQRRKVTSGRIGELQERLGAAEKLCSGKACVYATGSFARSEANSHSDLDLFIVGQSDKDGERRLGALDEICVKADLIEATRDLGIPDFSRGGEYLEHYTINQLVNTLGTPDDDANNTFTARLLLLLESYPLLEAAVYKDVIEGVLAAYWQDYENNKNEFMPAFLANDILRLWRTFCVNYEARTSREPEEKRAKRKLKNYKLKHSRLLTCYSAILYLLCIYSEHQTVSPGDATQMVYLTPTRRLEWLLTQNAAVQAHDAIAQLILHYESFLKSTDAAEDDLVKIFLDREKSREYRRQANKFGDLMFEVLSLIGSGTQFHRLLVV
jgi:predicted nucleotidyltransferase